jgi:hypothetical protein
MKISHCATMAARLEVSCSSSPKTTPPSGSVSRRNAQYRLENETMAKTSTTKRAYRHRRGVRGRGKPPRVKYSIWLKCCVLGGRSHASGPRSTRRMGGK